VLVEDTTISVGDDTIAIKAGKDWYGRTYGRESYNLTFRHMRIGAGHGVAVGSEMSAGVRDVVFDDFTLVGTATGPRLKSQRGRGGHILNVTFKNFVQTSVGTGLDFTMYYSGASPVPGNASSTPVFAGVTVSNLTTTAVAPGKKSAGFFSAGLPESNITGLVLRDVDFGAPAKPVTNCSYTVGVCEGSVLPACPPCLTA
jgi:polygalacturonase